MKRKLLVYMIIPLMVMSFFLAQDVYASSVETNAAPADLTLGGLFPLTGGLSGGGVEREAAFRLAIEEINNDTTLLPNTELKFLVRDTTTDPTVGATVAAELAGLGVFGFVGAASSDVSKAIAAVSEANEIPQVSYSSTNADLSQKLVYPWFLRTAPPDSIQGAALASILFDDLSIEEVATLATADSYGAGGISVFQLEYLALGGKLAASQQFPQGASDVSTQLQAIVDSGAKVIVLNAIVGDTATVMAQAAAVGITPANGYQWVGTDGATQDQVFTDSSNVVDADIRDAMAGMFGTAPNRGEGAVYEAFLDLWESCNGQSTAEYAGCGDRSPNTFATFAYDAVYTFARAAHVLVTADVSGQGADNGTALLEELYKTSFVGATGSVSFDANGDRIGVYDILNHNGTNFVDIGNWDTTNGAVFTSNIVYASGYDPAVTAVVSTATETSTIAGETTTVTSVSVSTESPGFGVFLSLITLFSAILILRRRDK